MGADAMEWRRAAFVSCGMTHGVHAITGGLGGLGLRAAAMLVSSGACEVLLASRSGVIPHETNSGVIPHETKAARLHSIASAPMRVWHVPCDVGDAADAVSLLSIRSRISGVLHAAGILRDKMIRSASIDGAHAVF